MNFIGATGGRILTGGVVTPARRWNRPYMFVL